MDLLSDWLAPLTLVFGGCCSNALTLEQITSLYPNSGSLITFAQFLLVSAKGLTKHVYFTNSERKGLFPSIPIPHFKPPRIPLTAYIIQVILFYTISLLNNMAFAYKIPMPVHIIFRSGGLVVSMCLGRLVLGRRYTLTQVLSVLLVTVGVIITTFSASESKSKSKSKYSSSSAATTSNLNSSTDTIKYITGIAILSLALLCSGFLGIAQDKMYTRYGHRSPDANNKTANESAKQAVKQEPEKQAAKQEPEIQESEKQAAKQEPEIPQWQESMFYIHFLAMPMFFFVRKDLGEQFASVTSGPQVQLSLSVLLGPINQFLRSPSNATAVHSAFAASEVPPSALTIPSGIIALVLTTLTNLVCISGVHRLTSRVSSLTVTLILTVRKAVSLIISVLLFSHDRESAAMQMMWTGAALVGLGTIGYTLGVGKKDEKVKEE